MCNVKAFPSKGNFMLSIRKMQIQSACEGSEHHPAPLLQPLQDRNGKTPPHSPLVHFEFDARAFVPGPAHHLLLGNGKTEGGMPHCCKQSCRRRGGTSGHFAAHGPIPWLRLTSIRLTASSIAAEVEAISFSTMSPSSSCLMSKLFGLSSCQRREQQPGGFQQRKRRKY